MTSGSTSREDEVKRNETELFSPAGSRRSAGLLCSEWWSHCRWLLLKSRTLEDKHTESTVRKWSHTHTKGQKPSHTHTLQQVSPRCVICSGIWTGICSAATELGAGLPPLSSNRVSRICSEEEEGLPGPDEVCEDAISSWRPFRRTDDTHRVISNWRIWTRFPHLIKVCVCVCVFTTEGDVLVIGYLSLDAPPLGSQPLRRPDAAPPSCQILPPDLILVLHLQLGYPETHVTDSCCL